MQRISPFLWFHGDAEDAVKLYVSLFANSRITEVARYPEGSPGPAGEVMTVGFELEGQKFTALNGDSDFSFNESISFVVSCESQEEVDRLWDALCEGGQESQCGWLKDRFGLSWQIVPSGLGGLLGGTDPEGAQRAMQAMLKMSKLDIKVLQDAYDGP